MASTASASGPSLFFGPGLDVELRNYQGTGSTFLSMLRAADKREKVTAPYEEVPTLRACLKAKSQAVASVPLCFYRGDPIEDKNAERLTREDPRFGALVRLFEEPNPLHTTSQFLEASSLHRMLDGEDFWFLLDKQDKPVTPDASGRFELPMRILPIRGMAVSHELDQFGFPRLWRFNTAGGTSVEAEARSVIQFRDYNPDDPLRGLGDVETLVADIDYWWQATRYNRALVKHGGDPGGWVIDESANAMAPEEREAAEKDAEQKFGVANAGKWKFLPRGLKYQANTIAPKDMNFGELMKLTRLTIASTCGVPLPYLGDMEHATLNNYAEAVRMFWEGGNGIVPYLASVKDVLQNRFVRKLRIPGIESVFVSFDLRHVKALRDDTSKQWEIVSKLHGLGMSIDESMKLVGLEGDTSEMPYAGTRLVSSTLVALPAIVGEDGAPAGADVGSEAEVPTESNPAPMPGAVAVQDTALNGAQTASLLSITQAVSDGTLNQDAAVAMILAAFPTISEELAKRIVAGTITKEPEPEPAAPAGDPPADPPKTDPPVEDPPADDEAKSLTRSIEHADAAESERRDYWASRASRLLDKSESRIRRAYRGWRRKYERAQLARLRAIAADAKAIGSKAPDGPGADGPPLDSTPWFKPEDLDPLLVNEAEWIAKLRAAVQDPISQIFADAIEDIAADLGTAPIPTSGTDIAHAISQQTIKLAEGHNSTLAKQVREVLEQELSKANRTGSVQQALAETLDSVEESLSETWADRQNRAQVIARTETGRAVNHARTEQMKHDGIVQHEWIAQNDEATRESHKELDGKVVTIGQEFKPNLREPGDGDAPASEVVNCRCLTRPVRIETPSGGEPVEEQ